MFDGFLLYHIKKNSEKVVFFALFFVMCILLILLILNLPSFKVSLFGKKISHRAKASVIDKVDMHSYHDLQHVLTAPVDYVSQYVRDPFSPYKEDKNEFDSDEDGMPNEWEKRYSLNPYEAKDAYLDKDGDMFTNIDEFKAGTDPTDPLSKPEEYNPLGRYRLVSIFKRPLELLFDGYMQLPDKSYSFVINAGATTYFKRLGESINGYKITHFEKKLSEENRMGVALKNDESELSLEDENGEKLILIFHRITTKKELWVKITDLEKQSDLELRKGDSFGKFNIVDVTASGISLLDTENNKFNLKYERRKR